MNIPFNKPYMTGRELVYVNEAYEGRHISGDGKFTRLCHRWLESKFNCRKALLTHSGTAALEMAAILLNIKEGDEVIMPSFTFSSTANAFVLRGARIVFVDVRPDTMNLDEAKIEKAVTRKTRAVVAVHYAGLTCEMDNICKIAKKYGLSVVEDAAHAFLSQKEGKYAGTCGDIGCFSFHETKNISCGEGGAVILNNADLVERAEIIREKGTDRRKFFRGEVDRYSWVDIGSSYLPSDANAAILYAQLRMASAITKKRISICRRYFHLLLPLQTAGHIELPSFQYYEENNGHIFYIKARDEKQRDRLLIYLNNKGINAIFHFMPLHTSKAGKRWGRFSGKDEWTSVESSRLIRLPVYYELSRDDTKFIVDRINDFYRA